MNYQARRALWCLKRMRYCLGQAVLAPNTYSQNLWGSWAAEWAQTSRTWASLA